jgi:hypothetical protein
MLDATSALHGNMPQHNDEEGGKQPRVAFFHQFFGLTNNPALAPFASVPCPCQRYFMGGEGAWDHINSCLHHASNWTCAQDHVLRALERICNDAGFATTHKRVLTSEGNQLTAAPISKSATSACRVSTICWKTSPFATISKAQVTMDRLKASSATPTTRTTSSRAPLPTRSTIIATHFAATGIWLFCRRACLPRHFFHIQQVNRQAEHYFEALGYQPHSQEFCALSPSRRLLAAKPGHHRDGLCSGCGFVWRPHHRAATSLPLAARRPSTWPTMIMTGMSATSTASLRPYS